MKILITGAFGGIGTEVLRQALERGYKTRVFELDTPRNRQIAAKLGSPGPELLWGDLRNCEDLRQAVEGQDVVIHLGAIIPPLSEKLPELAEAVNVGGTRNIVQALKETGQGGNLVLASSMEIMKIPKDPRKPVRVDDPVEPSSAYARHKIACEALVRDSGLDWAICRLAAVINVELSAGGGSIIEMLDKVFEMSLDGPIEGVWNIDAATALLNAASGLHQESGVAGKTFFVGGGEDQGWQLSVREFYTGVFGAVGFGMLDERCFNTQGSHTLWLDTKEAQDMLAYQNHSFTQFTQALRRKMGFTGALAGFFGPAIRAYMQGKSRYRPRRKPATA